MNKMSLALPALVMLQLAGPLQSLACAAAPSAADAFPSRELADRILPSRVLIAKPHACAPDEAEPVWGSINDLVGFRCVPPRAGGS